jgi:PAS domain S-box-containing protein
MAETSVWIVEDESIVAMDLKARLLKMGYSVAGISGYAEEAIEEICLNPPDIVLMDIVLKGSMDGIEAAAIIREELEIPVVYLTAYSEDGTISRAKVTEPYGYILKPFMERDLRIAIEIALYKSMMERRLRASERWLKSTMQSMGEGIIATDIGGFVRFMNPVASRLTGVSEDKAIGTPSGTTFLIENGNGSQGADPVLQALRDQRAVYSDQLMVLVSSDANRRFVEYTATPILDEKDHLSGAVLIFRDISDRVRVEEELRRHREHLEELVAERTLELRKVNARLEQTLHYIDMAEKKWVEEALVSEVAGSYTGQPRMPDGLISIDSDLHVRLINYAAEEMTGWTQKDAENQPLSALLSLEDHSEDAIANRLRSVVEGGARQPLEMDCILLRRDGVRMQVRVSVEPFRDHSGVIIGATVSLHRM